MTPRSDSIRTSTVSKLAALAFLLLPTAAQAGWGDENWGVLVWADAAPPEIPILNPWLLLGVAALLMLSGVALLRGSRRAIASASACVGLLLLVPWGANAAQITLPFTFVNGTVANADDVNADFATLESESNAQDLRIGLNEGGIATIDGRVTALEALTPGDITGVSAGAGLTGGGLSGDVGLSADFSALQARVASSCPAGQSIRAIDVAGAVTCEPDDDSGGDITGVTAGTGLTGGGVSGAVSLFLDTAYTDGRYVNATGDTISGNLSVTGRVGAGGGGYSNVTIVARERLPAGTDDYLLWMEDTAQARKFSVTVAGDTYAAGGASFTTVTIRGGADVAEPFDIIDQHKVVPGHLVAIDAARPGELRLADAAYDRTVAGIVSGAGGVQPGMLLHQEGSEADGAVPVALTGRVYAWADADANGSIVPGDLLTTSPTAGHAMRATDRERSHGAVIGKAMTSVEKGRGLVLVLVSLQ